MNQVNRILFIIVIGGAFLVGLTCSVFAGAEKLDKTKFRTEIETAFTNKDTVKISVLVAENRFQTGFYLSELLKNYIVNELAGNIDESQTNLRNARLLADQYQSLFSSSVLTGRVNRYENWSQKEMTTFVKGDSIISNANKAIGQTQFQAALTYWRRAAAIFKSLGEETLLGQCLGGIGISLRNLNLFQPSIDTLKLALEIDRKVENRYHEANALRAIGIPYYIIGDRDKALDYWQQAAKIFHELKEKSTEGLTLGHIAIYYRTVGNVLKAKEYHEQAMAIAIDLGNKPNEAIELTNLARLMEDLGDYNQAIKYAEQALQIKREFNQLTHVGILLNNLGNLNRLKGDFQKSLNYLQESIEVREQLSDSVGLATSFMNVGATYFELNFNDRAMIYFEKALPIFRRFNNVNLEALTLMNMGVIYERKQDYEAAIKYAESARSLFEKNARHDMVALCLNNMAAAYDQMGHHKRAIEYLNLALTIAENNNDIRAKMSALNNFGQIYFDLGEYEKALDYFKKNLELAKTIKPQHKGLTAQFGIGRIYEKQMKSEEALKWYKETINTIEASRTRLTIEPFKQSFMSETIEAYHAIVRLLVELDRFSEAFEYMERSKARTLLDILAADRIDITEGIEQTLLEEKHTTEWELQQTNSLISKEFSKKEGDRNNQYIYELEQNLESIRSRHEGIIERIRLRHPRYANLTGIRSPLSLKEIQDKILTDELFLVEYLVTKEQTFVCLVIKESVIFKSIDITAEELTALVDSLLLPYRNLALGKLRNIADLTFDLKLAHEIYNRIFQPIEEHLSENKSIIVVPDDVLHYLPFEALVTRIEKKQYDRNITFSRFENAHYLMEKYAFSYAPSASVLAPELLYRKEAGKKGILAFANPYSSEAVTLIKKDEKEQGILNFFSLLIKRSPEDRAWSFSQLPFSEDEVRQVARMIKPSEVYIGMDANESSFKKKADQFRYLHLSTHAVTEENQPMYSRIVLSPDRRSEEDGFLHAYEVMNLHINSEMVTLSACQTGLGKLSRGEGLIGLTRAFMYAGASSVLVSLWSVDDASTATLMKHFYQNLKKGKAKSDALRRAKLSMLKTREQKMSYAMPFLWAPFVLVGDWD